MLESPMPEAQLTIELPERVWIAEVSSAYPDATFRILAAVPGDSTGYALVRVSSVNVSEIVSDMQDHAQITDLTVVQRSDAQATIQFDTTVPLLLFCSQASGLPFTLPVDIVDGEATVEVTGSTDRLAALGDQLRSYCFDFRVEYVHEHVHTSQLLSDRQREVVRTAIERGYYDSPRRCTLTELAEILGIAKSTCSETLQRVEGTIIKQFVSDMNGFPEEEALTAENVPTLG